VTRYHEGIVAQVWAEADASLCDKCMAPNVVINQPVLGHVFKGLDKVKDLVENHYKKVRPDPNPNPSITLTLTLTLFFLNCHWS